MPASNPKIWYKGFLNGLAAIQRRAFLLREDAENHVTAALVARVERATLMTSEGRHEAAHKLLREVEQDARQLQIKSAYLLFCIGVALDNVGDPHTSMRYLHEALAIDPLAAPFVRSVRIVTGRLTYTLMDEDEPPEARLQAYQTLAHYGQADGFCHLAAAQLHAELGHADEAMRLAEAVRVIAPHLKAKADAVTAMANRKRNPTTLN